MVKLLSKTFLILLIFGLIVISPVSYFYNAQYTYVYAESLTDPVNRDEVVEAFRAYCKSRDLTIDGSIADAVTSFTTHTFNLLCNKLGIDITALQSEIYKAYTENSEGLPVFSRYIISGSGIALLNRIFAQFLQDNDLEVGDTNVNKIVKSGKWFVDNAGHGCFCYTYNPNITATDYPNNQITSYGTTYRYTAVYLKDQTPQVLNTNYNFTVDLTPQFNSNSSTISLATYYYVLRLPEYVLRLQYPTSSSTSKSNILSYSSGSSLQYEDNTLIIIYNEKYHDYHFGFYNHFRSQNVDKESVVECVTLGTYSSQDTDVLVNTPEDDPIKPALPDDEPIDIYPDGSTSNDPEHNIPEPGGSDPGWTIPDGTITPDGDGGSTFDWNFQLPNLNIDWSINGLTNKFPFCIPFDVVSFCQVLSTEPVAPRISGNVPIGTLTTWTFDYDLSEYNSWASLLRTVELFGFVIGLIFITVKLVKG